MVVFFLFGILKCGKIWKNFKILKYYKNKVLKSYDFKKNLNFFILLNWKISITIDSLNKYK